MSYNYGGGYGQQQQPGGYGGPPPQHGGGYGGPPPSSGPGGYGAPQGGYGSGPPPQHGAGYGQQSGGYGGAPGGGYGGAPPPGGQGGYGAGPHRPRPPSAMNQDPQLYQWFQAVDRDRSGHISATELQQALVNGDWTAFDIDTVKMLIAIFDTDRSGTIGFDEFAGIWKYIKDWQNVFRHFDADNSGTISGPELNNAMTQFGYNLPPNVLQLLQRKYVTSATPDDKTGGFATQRNRDGGITFDRFVRCCVVIKTLTESFQRADTDRDGWITVSYVNFVEMAMSAP